jgi:hypothetical protein
MGVVKVNQDVAYVAMSIYVLQMSVPNILSIFQTYVASVFIWILFMFRTYIASVLSRFCICFCNDFLNVFRFFLQVFHMLVSNASSIFRHMLEVSIWMF